MSENNLDNRRLFLAAILSLAVLLLWQWVFPGPERVPPVREADLPEASRPAGATEADALTTPAPLEEGVERSPTEASSAASREAEAAAAASRELIVADAEQTVEIGNERFTVRLSNRGGQITSFRLNHRLDPSGEPLELVRERSDDARYPFAWVDEAGVELELNRQLFKVERPRRDTVVFRYSGPLGLAEKRFEFRHGGLLQFSASLQGSSQSWGLFAGPGVRNPGVKELGDRFQRRFRRVSYAGFGEVTDLEASKVDVSTELPGSALRWVALEDKYFLTAWMVSTPLRAVQVVPVVNLAQGDEISGYQELTPVAAEGDDDLPRDLELALVAGGDQLAGESYWGAKEYARLRALPYNLEETVRFGMFGFIAKPLLYGLRWLHDNVVSNYGWSIVLMTLVIKVALFPLTHKSYVSMKKLQLLNPRMEAIRNRYRPKLRDKQGRPNLEMQRKMNEEMQALFKQEGVSPAGGCLPLLLQMPVFLAFYQLLSHAVELWGSPWMLWIHDLSARDPIWVLPLVMGATQLAHTKMMPTPTNPSQRIIMTTMPIWFTIISLGFPAGLVLYWLTNNVLTIVQQAGYNRLKKAGFFGGPDEEPAKKGAQKNVLKTKGSANAKST